MYKRIVLLATLFVILVAASALPTTKAVYNCTNPNLSPDPGGPYSGAANQAVSVFGSSSYDNDDFGLTRFRWFFGDGTNSGILTYADVDTTHTYSSAGTYTVTLLMWNTYYYGTCSATTTASISN